MRALSVIFLSLMTFHISSLWRPVAAAEPPSLADAEIEKLIHGLDADQFLEREAAMLKLIDAGSPVIEPLARTLASSSLEVTTRGIFILRELASVGDEQTSNQAEAALRGISKSRTTAAARRAEAALEALDEIRQTRAVRELSRLGALIDTSRGQFGMQFLEFFSVTIDGNWRGEISDLHRLKWLRDVQQVSFEGDQVTDEWISYVRSMTNLTMLSIKRTRVGDQGIAYLKSLENLQYLDLWYSPVTDASVEHLQQLQRARGIKIYGTGITPQGATRLREALPKEIEFDFKQGAFLGVACEPPPSPCVVREVRPATAAERAGLEVGDIIVSYDGTKVADFDDLKEQIGRNRGGDAVVLHVIRGAEPLARTVTREEGTEFGIQFSDKPYGCQIGDIAPDSPAARGGLKSGDLVVGFQGNKITSAKALQNEMDKSRPGETVVFAVIRGIDNVLTKKVTFGEWQ